MPNVLPFHYSKPKLFRHKNLADSQIVIEVFFAFFVSMNFTKQRLFFFVFLTAMFIQGCREILVEIPEQPEHHLFLEFVHHVGGEPLVYFKPYSQPAGSHFNVTLSRFYVSNIRLIKSDSSEVAFNEYLLVKPFESSEYLIDNTIIGSYSGIHFDIGVDAATNLSNPSSFPPENPLANQSDVSMHFGLSSAGYIFLKLEGQSDTSVAGTGAINFPFEFHIGSNNLLRPVKISRNFEIKPNTDVTIVIAYDIMKMLDGVNLKLENNTRTFDNPLLAQKIASTISKSFSLAVSE